MLLCSSYTMVLASLLALLHLFVDVAAYPNGPGSCAAGASALQQNHLSNKQIGTGPLADKGFEIRLNGVPLTEGVAFDAPINVIHNLELGATKNGTTFRGFLIRLAGDGVDTTTTLMVPDGVTDVQVLRLCVDIEDVGGIAHNSKSMKSRIHGLMKLSKPADNMTMDVTVVVNNDKKSEWYFSAFTVNAVRTLADTGVPTSAPVSASSSPVDATAAPVSSSPTADTSSFVPTVGTSFAPISPSTNGSATPTVGPTVAPIKNSPNSGITSMPTFGSSSPTIDEITSLPTIGMTPAPVTFSPARGATPVQVTFSPARRMTRSPVTFPPARGMTPAPVTLSPARSMTPVRNTPSPTKISVTPEPTLSHTARPTSLVPRADNDMTDSPATMVASSDGISLAINRLATTARMLVVAGLFL